MTVPSPDRYFVINDNEVYHFTDGTYKVYDYTLDDPAAAVPAVLQTLEMEVAHIMKGGFDHFMQKEIHEQPESILQSMRGRVKFSGDPETVRPLDAATVAAAWTQRSCFPPAAE